MIVDCLTSNRAGPPARVRYGDDYWYFTGSTGVAFSDGFTLDVAQYEHEEHGRCWYTFDGLPVEVRAWLKEDRR